ncbi:MAG: radical SAM protein [Lachnospiraceae bacterium]|nr:radical SAM protein [Lachnospiraceae bacterium]
MGSIDYSSVSDGESNMINIARIHYPVKTLGPGDRIGIWVAGCQKNCPGCISPELQNKAYGRCFSTEAIMKVLMPYLSPGVGITLSGGEPFLYASGVARLLDELNRYTKDVIVFTGYTIEELTAMNDHEVERVLSYTGLLVDGAYIDELNDGKGMRGSTNQKFVVLGDPEKYKNPETWERELQLVVGKGKIYSIGIPGVGQNDKQQ